MLQRDLAECRAELAQQLRDARDAQPRADALRRRLREKGHALRAVERALRQDGPPGARIAQALRALAGEGDGDGAEPAGAEPETARAEPGDAQPQEPEAALAAKVAEQAEVIESAARERALMQQRVDDQRQTIEELRLAVAALTADKAKLAAGQAELQRVADARERAILAEKERCEARILAIEEQCAQRVEEQVAAVQRELQGRHEKLVDEFRSANQAAQARIRTVKKKLGAQTDQVAKLQERLEAVNRQLEGEIEAGQTAEASYQSDIARLESSVKDLKSALAAAEFDQRMLLVKQEQWKHERSLAETRSQLTDLGLEASHQRLLEEQKDEFDAKFRAFVESISRELAEFTTFASPISEQSIQDGLKRIVARLSESKQLTRELQAARNQIVAVRRALSVADDQDLLPAVKALGDIVAAGWEEWAIRVHAMTTNSFSITRTTEELQVSLEELLVGAKRSNVLARKLEILRFEKRLMLTSELPLERSPPGKAPTFLALASVGVAVRRLQKLAGLLDLGIAGV
jgi:chromosome segregation ATPase